MAKSIVKHKGIVKRVGDTSIIVSIINQSACSECHAKGACSIADYKEKEIEILKGNKDYKPGQVVNVLFRESAGFKALFLGYILPFLLVIVVLLIVYAISNDEAIAGLLSLGILIPYYIVLYFFRHRLKNVFKFELEEFS